jgi:hypothetical protein
LDAKACLHRHPVQQLARLGGTLDALVAANTLLLHDSVTSGFNLRD